MALGRFGVLLVLVLMGRDVSASWFLPPVN